MRKANSRSGLLVLERLEFYSLDTHDCSVCMIIEEGVRGEGRKGKEESSRRYRNKYETQGRTQWRGYVRR